MTTTTTTRAVHFIQSFPRFPFSCPDRTLLTLPRPQPPRRSRDGERNYFKQQQAPSVALPRVTARERARVPVRRPRRPRDPPPRTVVAGGLRLFPRFLFLFFTQQPCFFLSFFHRDTHFCATSCARSFFFLFPFSIFDPPPYNNNNNNTLSPSFKVLIYTCALCSTTSPVFSSTNLSAFIVRCLLSMYFFII